MAMSHYTPDKLVFIGGMPFFDARQRMAKKTSIGSALCTPTVTLAELSQGSSEIMLVMNLTPDAHKSARRTVCN